MKKDINFFLKTKINTFIKEGYKFAKRKGLTDCQRDYMIKYVIDNKIEEAINYILKNIKDSTILDEEDKENLIDEIEEEKLIIEKYYKKKLKNLRSVEKYYKKMLKNLRSVQLAFSKVFSKLIKALK